MPDTKTRQQTRPATEPSSEENPFDNGSGSLQTQAAMYAAIAREASEACQRGDDAAQALQQRRNRSGQ